MAAADFHTAYEEAMARWPVPVERREVVSEFGTTRVNVCGAAGGPPLVLLHGGGTTSAAWYTMAAALAPTHRLYAVDQMGTPGLSVPGGRAVRRPADLSDWLDGVLDGLGLASAALLGHSYGGWVALRHAVHTADGGPVRSSGARVDRLVLLDPTRCFAGFRVPYLARALPLFLRPGEPSTRRLLEWEAYGEPPAPGTVRLMGRGAVAFRDAKVVTGPRPDATRLRGSGIPVLVLLAGRSRAHDVRRVAAGARRALPDAVVTTVPGVGHHAMPDDPTGEVGRRVLSFLAAAPGAHPAPPAAP
ncbi:alpha/beta fold hydrolase [Streptomyces lydicus]|uniref:alpha/beta fold hydrolase n=1 Tax=Streptomyces lydicus TaxID=47763 RepID=UPI0037BC033F